jgi:RND family efflux transporter MFP subunit
VEPSPPAARIRWGRIVVQGLKIVIPVGIVAAIVYWVRFAPVPVTAQAVELGTVVAETMGTGTLEARVKATISPKISGRIVALLVDQGDRVEAGQVLVRLDDSDLQQQVEIAESSHGAAQAAVARQAADQQRAKAVLDLAHIDYERVNGLSGQGSASSFEMDQATEGLRVAEAGLGVAEAALAEARKNVLVAQKTLGYQRALLANTVVTAPFPGLIARRDHDPGDIIVPGTSVLLLLATDEMWISAWIDETEMGRLNPGQPARVVFRSGPEKSYTGEVARLGRETDRETREFLVDVRVTELPANWAAGQRAEVYIETGRAEQAVRVPARFVLWRDGRPGAFVAQAGRAAWRAVQPGLRGRDLVEIRDGLRPGEQLIVPAKAGAGPLRDGQRVVVP